MKAPRQLQPQPWIKLRCKELGKTLSGLGKAMGELHGSRLTEIIAGTRRVQSTEVAPMAGYLELPYEVVYQRLFGSVPSLGGDVRSPRVAPKNDQDEVQVFAVRDLGGGIVELSDEPAAYVPAANNATTDAYDCYVVSDHMSPAYERGDCLRVNLLKPAAPGNDVLLISGTTGEPRKAALRHLTGITDTHWIVKQWKPEKTERFDRKTWHTAQRIESVRRR